MLRDELNTSVGDEVGEVVPGIVIAIVLLFPIMVEGVVIELAILHQPVPLIPAWWNPVAIILVQVFSIICGLVPTLL